MTGWSSRADHFLARLRLGFFFDVRPLDIGRLVRPAFFGFLPGFPRFLPNI
jgi:hypothetical protein